MKTIGEILKNAREDKKLSLEDVEKVTKIRKKYLEALEEDKWQKIPSFTYIHGFLKNYAQFLNLDLSLIMAVFRRQSQPVKDKPKVLPQGLVTPLNEPFWKLTPSRILAIFTIFLIFVFFSWLFWQYQSFVWAPKIIIEQPKENEVFKGDIIRIVGQTDPWAVLTINNQSVKLIDGKFDQEITVKPGINTINISATNKFGKKQETTRTVRVENP
ncbi:MAG: helix-turn-helix domain-containing protein [Candidatus Gottesmanbacteria bacterium]